MSRQAIQLCTLRSFFDRKLPSFLRLISSGNGASRARHAFAFGANKHVFGFAWSLAAAEFWVQQPVKLQAGVEPIALFS